MRNITVKVEDQTYRDIRAWCAQRDICVSRLVRAFLSDLPRLQNVLRFPLPDGPDSRSLGERFNAMELSEIDGIRQRLGALR